MQQSCKISRDGRGLNTAEAHAYQQDLKHIEGQATSILCMEQVSHPILGSDTLKIKHCNDMCCHGFRQCSNPFAPGLLGIVASSTCAQFSPLMALLCAVLVDVSVGGFQCFPSLVLTNAQCRYNVKATTMQRLILQTETQRQRGSLFEMHLQDAMNESLYHLHPVYLDAHGPVCLE